MVEFGIYKQSGNEYFCTKQGINNDSFDPINLKYSKNMFTFIPFKSLLISVMLLSLTVFSSDFTSVNFMNQQSGYIAGSNGSILKTTDCGNSWVQINSPGAGNIIDFVILGETSIMVITDGSVFYTADDGANWESRMEGLTGTFRSLVFTYDARLFICGDNSAFFVSNDFGNSWESIQIPQISNLKKLYFLDGNWGYLVGSNGLIMVTADGGNSWVKKNNIEGTRVTYNSISMVDDKIGIIIGDNGEIIRTTNNWNSWKSIICPAGEQNLYDVTFTSPGNALISGNRFILKSSNNGGDWEFSSFTNSLPKSDLRSLCFISAQTGFAVGTNNTVLFTNNSGNSWTKLNSGLLERRNNESSKLNNYPNPFNPSTNITFDISADSYVSLKVYDITGRQVADLLDSYKLKGEHSINFNASSLSSGIYFYTLKVKNNQFEYTKTNRMLLVK